MTSEERAGDGGRGWSTGLKGQSYEERRGGATEEVSIAGLEGVLDGLNGGHRAEKTLRRGKKTHGGRHRVTPSHGVRAVV
jgi:hypothetical protein